MGNHDVVPWCETAGRLDSARHALRIRLGLLSTCVGRAAKTTQNCTRSLGPPRNQETGTKGRPFGRSGDALVAAWGAGWTGSVLGHLGSHQYHLQRFGVVAVLAIVLGALRALTLCGTILSQLAVGVTVVHPGTGRIQLYWSWHADSCSLAGRAAPMAEGIFLEHGVAK